MIVGGVDVGGGGVNVEVGNGVPLAVGVGPGVRVGRRVEVGMGVLEGVAVGASTRVGVTSTSGGYNSSMAEYQSRPPVRVNSVKRVPA